MSNFEKRLKDNLEKVMKEMISEKNLTKIAEAVVSQIIKRTKLGVGVNASGGEEPLKPLSKPYIKSRQNMKKLNKTTTPAKSNLTQTGEMLDSLKFKIVGTEIIIFLDDKESNQKADWQQQQGRTFLSISEAQRRRIRNLIRSMMNEEIKKNWPKN